MEELTVIKVGGKVLENTENLHRFVQQVTEIPGKKVIVHGGGVMADQLLRKQGLKPKMLNGRRVTDEETLETIIMTYGGLVNKKVVANLVKNGVRAVGLTGADGLIAESVKRPSKPVDYGYAGDIVNINTGVLLTLLKGDYVPVIAPLSMTTDGQILNTNADTIVTQLAIYLAKDYQVNLIYGFEIDGVMRDIEEPSSLIRQLDASTYRILLDDGIIHSGMVPKLDNAFESVAHTARTIITHFDNIKQALAGDNARFTQITKQDD